MRIDVALLPGQSFDHGGCVCVVVDVLRASSSIVTLLTRRVSPFVAAQTSTRRGRCTGGCPGYLLCGEKDGLPPPALDYGNSPVEFSRLGLAGESAILATSNGTRVLAGLANAPAVLVRCLLNSAVVAGAAVRLARERDLDISIVRSAAFGGSRFVLEDALGAGRLSRRRTA